MSRAARATSADGLPRWRDLSDRAVEGTIPRLLKYHLEFLDDFDDFSDFGDFGGGLGDFGGDFGDVDAPISTPSRVARGTLGWVRRGPEWRRVVWWRRAVRQATRRRTAPGPRAPHRPRRTNILSRGLLKMSCLPAVRTRGGTCGPGVSWRRAASAEASARAILRSAAKYESYE